MAFQGPNQDMASLQPAAWKERSPRTVMPRDARMPWAPDLVLDATEWIQRAHLGDESAIRVVNLAVAPLLLEEVKKQRDISV